MGSMRERVLDVLFSQPSTWMRTEDVATQLGYANPQGVAHVLTGLVDEGLVRRGVDAQGFHQWSIPPSMRIDIEVSVLTQLCDCLGVPRDNEARVLGVRERVVLLLEDAQTRRVVRAARPA
jgi:hypothetical protein